MSGLQRQGNSFPKLQKRIIIHLVESGPQTINETVEGISGHYKSSWIAFNSLRNKGLIDGVRTKEYRGREYPQFWLTHRGIYLALHEGADPATLLERTIKIYPESENQQFLIVAARVFGTKVIDTLFLDASTRSGMDEDVSFLILAFQIQRGFTLQERKQLLAALKKYPKQYQRWAKLIKQASQMLKELSGLL